MRKQTNQKPSYKYGEKIRTKDILRRLKRKGNLKEYVRMKYFLKLANIIGNAKLGYVSYGLTLGFVEEASDNFVKMLKIGFGYRLDGETVDGLTKDDIRILNKCMLFKVPVMALINIDTKQIQSVISKIPDDKIDRQVREYQWLH